MKFSEWIKTRCREIGIDPATQTGWPPYSIWDEGELSDDMVRLLAHVLDVSPEEVRRHAHGA